MKSLSTPLVTEKSATQSAWGEVYDIYLRAPLTGGVALTNLVAHYTLEEAAGATRVDAVAGNNLTDHATVGQVAAPIGYGAQFNAAASRYLDRADTAVLRQPGADRMFTGWVYLDSKSVDQGFLTKKTITGTVEYEVGYNPFYDAFVFSWDDGTFVFSILATSAGAPEAGRWYFLEAWYQQSTGSISIRVNRGTADVQTGVGTGVAADFGNFRIGNGYALAADKPADGRLWNWDVWNRLPTSAELDALYNSGHGLAHPYRGDQILRLCTVPGGVNFFTPKFDPEAAASRGVAQAYSFWPLKRDILRGTSEDQNDRLTFAASNVTAEYAQMLADIDWSDTPVVIRKISLNIATPTADDCATLFSGLIDSAKVTNEAVQFVCSNFLGSLTTTAPRENMHNNCRFRWGDDFCTAMRFLTENYKAKTVGSSSTTTLLKSAGLTEDAGANGAYGTDLVNALADGNLTASSAKAAYAAQAVTADPTYALITLTAHGLAQGTAITFSGTTAPTGLTFGTTYYTSQNSAWSYGFHAGANAFYVAATVGGTRIAFSTAGTAVKVNTVNDYGAANVKSSKTSNWLLNGAGDLGTLTQSFWTIPTAQGGIAEPSLKPYLQIDFGSAKTPRCWRISTNENTTDLSGLPRTLVFFSSSDAATWTFESYAELPPRGGVLYDILIPKAATKRYWRICIRNRWGQNKAYTMLKTVYAYENGRNWWAGGTVTFDAGTATVALRGRSFQVRESYSGECVVETMPVAPASGDTFVIERGCGRSFNHCAERCNTENFGGFLDLPFQAVIRA